jgi:patatin-like phospholipase/acyl hydrolase
MSEGRRLGPGEPRSAGAIPQRRIPQAWPKNRRSRILSIDGGGIRGIFPAAILAELERRYAGGDSIASRFDLVAGTSTGGILGLGLAAGYTAAELRDLYVNRGHEIFPTFSDTSFGRLRTAVRDATQYAQHIYDRDALQSLLTEKLGGRLFGSASVRLCIPAFEGKHSEVFVFKTPHHRDFQTDRYESMINVALATAAAPTYFRPLEHGGYTLVDGGVWANNPVMLAVIEALTSFDVSREQIDVLTIGCGDDKYVVSGAQISGGGLWHWRKIMGGAMRLQSLAATNQARLLLGPPSVIRIDAPTFEPKLRMDDWKRSVQELLPAAQLTVDEHGDRIAGLLLTEPSGKYIPEPELARE